MQPIRLIRLKKVILSILVSVITLTAQIPIGVYAAEEKHRVVEDLPFEVDGNGDHIVKALHYKYTYNRYVSLRDVAFALSGTAKHFELSVTGDGITITTGQDYVGIGGEGEPFPEPEIDETLEALRTLPEKYRAAIYLFYYEGLPVEQISRLLDRRESTVRSDLRRGRAKLKELLERSGL